MIKITVICPLCESENIKRVKSPDRNTINYLGFSCNDCTYYWLDERANKVNEKNEYESK